MWPFLPLPTLLDYDDTVTGGNCGGGEGDERGTMGGVEESERGTMEGGEGNKVGESFIDLKRNEIKQSGKYFSIHRI